jgi:hypothetical protein
LLQPATTPGIRVARIFVALELQWDAAVFHDSLHTKKKAPPRKAGFGAFANNQFKHSGNVEVVNVAC